MNDTPGAELGRGGAEARDGGHRRVFATNRVWTDYLELDDKTGRVRHAGHNTFGRFQQSNDYLIVHWDLYPTEIFVRESDRYVEVGKNGTEIDLRRGLNLNLGSALVPVETVSVRLPNNDRTIEIRPGTSDVLVYRSIFYHHEYLLSDLNVEVRSIFDLGAYTGISAIYFATQYPSANIIAVEPESSNFCCLLRNVSGLSRVMPLNAAVWSQDTRLFVHNADEHLPHWAFQTSPRKDHRSIEGVEAVSIGSLMSRFGLSAIDIMKMDIEGAEHEVFSENSDGWIPLVKCLAIETHDRFRQGVDALVTEKMAKNHREMGRRGENRIFIRSDCLR
jgi:FkbM family methyltransferase